MRWKERWKECWPISIRMNPAVYVIVLNYNGRRWLEACFKSLLATDYDNYKALLVDNASTDDSVGLVATSFPQIEIILNDSNAGFSAGNNAGIQRALVTGADYVVLLNPDTRVEPDWLRQLITVGEDVPEVGILGAVQLTYDGDEFNSWTETALQSHLDELRHPATARPWMPVEWVEGACFAIKRPVFDAIGFFDPIYFAFYEEIDFCRRAACAGFQTALVPRSRIHHQRGGSWQTNAQMRRKRDYQCDRSQFIYHLTNPRLTLGQNLIGYLTTLGTKTKDLARQFSLARAWDLLRLQCDVWSQTLHWLRKWRRDRARLRQLLLI